MPKMVSKTSIPKTKCIKFGEILIDENKKVVLLCVNCSEDFNLMADLCKHLKSCKPAKHIFEASKLGTKLFCDTGNLIKTVSQKSRELLIYGIKAKPNASSISDIEAEVLNPRWYTDKAASSPIRTLKKTYNNLIEEVTPFVQFKENVRSLSTPNKESKKILQSKVEADMLQNKPTKPLNKDTTSRAKNAVPSQTIAQHLLKKSPSEQVKLVCTGNIPNTSTPATVQSTLKRKHSNLAITESHVTGNPSLSSVKRARSSIEPTSNIPQKLAPILPKTCSIQPQTIKARPQISCNTQQTLTSQKPSINMVPAQKTQRSIPSQFTLQNNVTSPVPPVNNKNTDFVSAPTIHSTNNKQTVDILNKLQNLGLKIQRTNPTPAPPAVSTEKMTAAMEIIKKLQSKGMEIKRVPKTNSTTASVFPPQTPVMLPKLSTEGAKSKCMNSNQITRSTNSVLNNFLIRKCN